MLEIYIAKFPQDIFLEEEKHMALYDEEEISEKPDCVSLSAEEEEKTPPWN